jgi:hypothetical protein
MQVRNPSLTLCVYLNLKGQSYFISDTIMGNNDEYSLSPSTIYTPLDINHKRRSVLCRKMFKFNENMSLLASGTLGTIFDFIDDLESHYKIHQGQKPYKDLARELYTNDYSRTDVSFIFFKFLETEMELFAINHLEKSYGPMGVAYAIGSGAQPFLDYLTSKWRCNYAQLQNADEDQIVHFLKTIVRGMNAQKLFTIDNRRDWGGIIEDFQYNPETCEMTLPRSCLYISFDAEFIGRELCFAPHNRCFLYEPSNPRPFLAVGEFGSDIPPEIWTIELQYKVMTEELPQNPSIDTEEFVVCFNLRNTYDAEKNVSQIPIYFDRSSINPDKVFARIKDGVCHVSIDTTTLTEKLRDRLKIDYMTHGNLSGYVDGASLEDYFCFKSNP